MAEILAAVVYPVGAGAFLVTAVLLPLTFPDRQWWRFLLVWTCLGLGVFSLLLALTTGPFAVLEFQPSRLYIRLAYGATLCFLLPFLVIYFQRALELRVRMWFWGVRVWWMAQVARLVPWRRRNGHA